MPTASIPSNWPALTRYSYNASVERWKCLTTILNVDPDKLCTRCGYPKWLCVCRRLRERWICLDWLSGFYYRWAYHCFDNCPHSALRCFRALMNPAVGAAGFSPVQWDNGPGKQRPTLSRCKPLVCVWFQTVSCIELEPMNSVGPMAPLAVA
jgi:hypothetical protein